MTSSSSIEQAETAEGVRDLIERRGHDRRNGILPTAVAERLAERIASGICAKVRPWSRSSRPELARYFAVAIEAVRRSADPADDLPRDLLITVLGNTARRLDLKLAQITDPKETTHA